MTDLLLCPILVLYYGYDAYRRADWIGPTGILGLFLISIVINKILMGVVIRATVQLEKHEGNFRYWFNSQLESERRASEGAALARELR